MFAWPPVGSASIEPQTLHFIFVAECEKTIWILPQSEHLTCINLDFGVGIRSLTIFLALKLYYFGFFQPYTFTAQRISTLCTLKF